MWFVDVDDLIMQKGCQQAIRKAIAENLDVLGFEYYIANENGEVLKYSKAYTDYSTKDGISFAKRSFRILLVNQIGFAWRFLYNRSYLLEYNLKFAEGVYWEDTVFVPSAVIAAQRMGAIESVLYVYRQNSNSISGTMSLQKPGRLIFEFAFITGAELLHYSLSIDDDKLKNVFYEMAVRYYINGFLTNLLRTSCAERQNFYMDVRLNKNIIQGLRPYLTWFNRILLTPYLGELLTEMVSKYYTIRHKK